MTCSPRLAKACNVGDEGGFAPNVQDNNEVQRSFVNQPLRCKGACLVSQQALDVLMEAIEKSGHSAKAQLAQPISAR